MASIQFRSAEETISAFESTDCEVWSLWDGKRYMFKGVGTDELKTFLDLMNASRSSNAVYTLCYYEGVTDKKEVNNKTPYDGSFNFLLAASEGMAITNGQFKQMTYSNELQSKMGALENKLDAFIEKFDSEDADKEDAKGLGFIGELINHPSIAPVLPLLIKSIVEKLLGPGNSPAVVSSVPKLSQVAGIGTTPNYDDQLKRAIARLLVVDPSLAEHLNALADIAEKDSATFNYILSTLDTLKPA